jgi:hypothetical protein
MDQHKGKAALMKNMGWKGRQRREALVAAFRFVRCLLLLLSVAYSVDGSVRINGTCT